MNISISTDAEFYGESNVVGHGGGTVVVLMMLGMK